MKETTHSDGLTEARLTGLLRRVRELLIVKASDDAARLVDEGGGGADDAAGAGRRGGRESGADLDGDKRVRRISTIILTLERITEMTNSTPDRNGDEAADIRRRRVEHLKRNAARVAGLPEDEFRAELERVREFEAQETAAAHGANAGTAAGDVA